MNNRIRIIFIGTPEFAVPCLRALINDSQFEITAVITQPDKKVGRKQIITPPPVKIEAGKHNLLVWQPEKISDLKFQILDLKPDLIVVTAYAQLIPKEILEIPRYGSINVHSSLLPKYRGASCIQTAILNGDSETGITVIKMNEKLDSGPILFQTSLKIENNDTTILSNKLSKLAAKILPSTIKSYLNGELKPIEQDNSKSSYTSRIKKEQGKINWQNNALYLEKFVRAMYPWPGAWTKVKNDSQEILIKITQASNDILKIKKYKTGELFLLDSKLAVQCGQDALIIKKIQLAGKKEISADEFIRGHRKLIGRIFY